MRPAIDTCVDSAPLAAHRVLDHLHEDALAFEEQALDRSQRFVARARLADVGDVQEGGTAEADVDERRLHPRQDAHDASDIDVADEAATGAAFDVQFLHDALVHDGDARFLRREVDQDLFGHGGAIWRMGVMRLESRFAAFYLSPLSRPPRMPVRLDLATATFVPNCSLPPVR
jgi:hypothetical protein